MAIRRSVRLAAVLAVAAVASAGPVSAAPLEGTYTMVSTGPNALRPVEVTLSSCGAGCTHWQVSGASGSLDLHLQGNRWVGDVNEFGGSVSFDKDSLQGVNDMGAPSPEQQHLVVPFSLTKSG
ncbi:hypothetical protein [Mycobacterium sp.]|uniref:hypothetical protein n=1 Tax=Mycobacterium sp. TaxID=1785 RepID=UPI0025D52D25|nr:hypothetical protein [Mycobacterium sp.]